MSWHNLFYFKQTYYYNNIYAFSFSSTIVSFFITEILIFLYVRVISFIFRIIRQIKNCFLLVGFFFLRQKYSKKGNENITLNLFSMFCYLFFAKVYSLKKNKNVFDTKININTLIRMCLLNFCDNTSIWRIHGYYQKDML